MEIFIKVTQLLLSLSILVIIHELGHFIAARIFKTRVEKFYLFFNPWFSLFKVKIGETTYGLGWIPLGGYVKIAGMIDESMDKEQLKQPPQPYEFRSKPAWQRLIIMVGGVFMNIVLAFVIFIGMMYFYGEEYLPNSSVKYGIACTEYAKELGLKDGDKFVSIDGKTYERFIDYPVNIVISQPKIITVKRNDSLINIVVNQSVINKIIKDQTPTLFVSPRFPTVVADFLENSPASKSGIQKNDRLISINDTPTPFFNDFRQQLVLNKNKEVKIGVLRNNKDTLFVNLTVPESGLIGIQVLDNSEFLEYKVKKYNFFTAIPAGIGKTFTTINDYLKQLKMLISPQTEAYKSLGGFITIGKLFPGQWNWAAFWSMTALLSVVLAIMNLLPIPALDGGHVLFLLIEVISRRKPSEKVLEYAQMVGMTILIALLLYANGLDILRLFKN